MQKENRNNRVHTGDQSGKTEFPIMSLLPVGKENAISTADLVRLTGCKSARDFQERIAYERNHGAVICSGSGRGYWKPKNRQEIQEFVRTMDARALNTLRAAKSARAALKVPAGQQVIEGREMAEVKWIKIATDIFDDEKILLIESMPDSYAIITAWFKLLCLAGKQNNDGVFIMNDRIAYTDKMLATIFRMKETTVKLALDTFEQFGMIEKIDGAITIPNWGKHETFWTP